MQDGRATRRGFMKWLGAVAAATTVPPLFGADELNVKMLPLLNDKVKINPRLIDYAILWAENVYKVSCSIASAVQLPETADVGEYYHARDLLRFLETQHTPSQYIQGFTTVPLFSTIGYYPVVGFSYIDGNESIVSTIGYPGTSINLPKNLASVVLHELGHNFGAEGCVDAQCMMSEKIESFEAPLGSFCDEHRVKLGPYLRKP